MGNSFISESESGSSETLPPTSIKQQQNEHNRKPFFKFVLAGAHVGKTAFLSQVSQQCMPVKDEYSVGTELKANNKYKIKGYDVHVDLLCYSWNERDQLKDKKIHYFNGANSMIALYDPYDRSTYDALDQDIEQALEYGASIVIVANWKQKKRKIENSNKNNKNLNNNENNKNDDKNDNNNNNNDEQEQYEYYYDMDNVQISDSEAMERAKTQGYSFASIDVSKSEQVNKIMLAMIRKTLGFNIHHFLHSHFQEDIIKLWNETE